MLQMLQPLVKQGHDFYTFLAADTAGDIAITGTKYEDFGEYIDGSDIGYCYHIILFKENSKGVTKHLDFYNAILMDPLEYMSTLIPQGWYGMIGRKTTQSTPKFQEAFDKLKTTC